MTPSSAPENRIYLAVELLFELWESCWTTRREPLHGRFQRSTSRFCNQELCIANTSTVVKSGNDPNDVAIADVIGFLHLDHCWQHSKRKAA
jgi:hypothetical protein